MKTSLDGFKKKNVSQRRKRGAMLENNTKKSGIKNNTNSEKLHLSSLSYFFLICFPIYSLQRAFFVKTKKNVLPWLSAIVCFILA